MRLCYSFSDLFSTWHTQKLHFIFASRCLYCIPTNIKLYYGENYKFCKGPEKFKPVNSNK